MLERARAALPELPPRAQRALRAELGLHPDSAKLLAFAAELGDYFEARARPQAAADAHRARQLDANELLAGSAPTLIRLHSKVTPAALAALVEMVTAKSVTRRRRPAGAGRARRRRRRAGSDRRGRGTRLPLAAPTSSARSVEAALAANPDVAERLRGGDMKPIGVIVGHVMRETQGRADGGEVTRLVREQLGL